MSHVVSLQLKDEQMERLRSLARRLGRSPSEAGALAIEETLRRSEFPLLDFRDSPVGRQAYLQGTGLALWEIVLVARRFSMDAARVAEHLELPPGHIEAALHYADAHPDEINAAIEENEAVSFEALGRILPGTMLLRAGECEPIEEAGGEAE